MIALFTFIGFILGLFGLIFFKTKFLAPLEDSQDENDKLKSPQLPVWFGIVYFIVLCVPILGFLVGIATWIIIIVLLWCIFGFNNTYYTDLIYKEGWFVKIMRNFLTKTF